MRELNINSYFNDSTFGIEFSQTDRQMNRHGIPFRISNESGMDNISCLGQEIKINDTIEEMYFLGYCEAEAFREKIIFQTPHGEIDRYLDFSTIDQINPIGWVYDRDLILKNRSYFVYDVIKEHNQNFYLYCCVVPCSKQYVETIKLPDLELMHILAITVR